MDPGVGVAGVNELLPGVGIVAGIVVQLPGEEVGGDDPGFESQRRGEHGRRGGRFLLHPRNGGTQIVPVPKHRVGDDRLLRLQLRRGELARQRQLGAAAQGDARHVGTAGATVVLRPGKRPQPPAPRLHLDGMTVHTAAASALRR